MAWITHSASLIFLACGSVKISSGLTTSIDTSPSYSIDPSGVGSGLPLNRSQQVLINEYPACCIHITFSMRFSFTFSSSNLLFSALRLNRAASFASWSIEFGRTSYFGGFLQSRAARFWIVGRMRFTWILDLEGVFG